MIGKPLSNDLMGRTIIDSKPDSPREYFRKIWRFRALIWIFAVRDLKVKYAQTWLGLGWSVLQPLTSLVIFTFFFGHIFLWETEDMPYSIYVLSGLLGWNFFAYIVSAGAASVQESSHLIKKVYFPKSVLPLSKVFVAAVELIVSLLLLVPLMLYFGQSISWNFILLPFVILYNLACALGLVFWVASFAYKRRDLFHLLPYIVYFGIWLTPVFFVPDLFPHTIAQLLDFNPVANVVELWRWALFGYGSFKVVYVINFAFVLVLCGWGMYFFNQRENSFSDYV